MKCHITTTRFEKLLGLAALDCIDQYLSSFDETPERDSSIAVSTISGIVIFAHHLSMRRLGYSLINELEDVREENEK